MKSGTVLLIGRPNVGKSTLVNTILGKKISITSPKPQTTRFSIYGTYTDTRGTISFVDTPGIFDKAQDTLAKKINRVVFSSMDRGIDAVCYVVDHTRIRDLEEGRVLGIVRKINKPTILVFNKSDYQQKSHKEQYIFLQEEFPHNIEISALKNKHITSLIDMVYSLLPENTQTGQEEDIQTDEQEHKIFIAELIREKVFLMTGDEIPYTTTCVVDQITQRNKRLVYIQARIITTDIRYKKMLIGSEGRKIKEMGAYARKEIELFLKQKIYLDLTVDVDRHWQELY